MSVCTHEEKLLEEISTSVVEIREKLGQSTAAIVEVGLCAWGVQWAALDASDREITEGVIKQIARYVERYQVTLEERERLETATAAAIKKCRDAIRGRHDAKTPAQVLFDARRI